MGKLLTKKVWYLVSGDDIGDGVKVSVLDIFFGFGDNWQVDWDKWILQWSKPSKG